MLPFILQIACSLSLIGVEGIILQSLWLENWIQILIRTQKAKLGLAHVKMADWQTLQENPRITSDGTGMG